MTTAAPLTPAEVAALPAMPTALQAFAALNIGETLGYELIKQGEFPIEVVRFGRAFRVRKAELLAYLGLSQLVAAEVQSAAATTSDAPGVQPGAPVEQPAHTSK
ncbi:helix-turn-helix domain-containing protein [Streptomyces sp. I5]|uniref:helix-turn-helix domain-containing protein n=1 Tax=Streptomyces sp. I5 TaxID=2759947 RepID=UPI0018EE5106|nr:helix-turn-helix domain-containing protein [Streptomyces sp. I5]MBJ6633341.1 helix-turn-helix domain-containing protein [Streptomyces sp. I5]